MATYHVRPMRAGWFEVAKFDGHDQPEAVYDVLGQSCSCPRGGNCKHAALVRIHAGLRKDAIRTYWQDKWSKWLWYEILLEYRPPPPRAKAIKSKTGRRGR
jgi:hypothetical protein